MEMIAVNTKMFDIAATIIIILNMTIAAQPDCRCLMTQLTKPTLNHVIGASTVYEKNVLEMICSRLK